MLSAFIAIIGIILTIFFVIGTHEAGHFFAARLLGVKVLRFSIGFGKKLFAWHDKQGTEYVVALIPLGGYVKMLDETEGDVPPAELTYAYNRQPLYKKSLIVAAGPLINFFCAIMLYWLIYVIGFTTVKPIIGQITPDSIAAASQLQANQVITQVDGHETLGWPNVLLRLLAHLGNQDRVSITTQSLQGKDIRTYELDLANWKINELTPDPLSALGLQPAEPSVPLVIGSVASDSPAQRAGLNVGDRVVAVDKKSVTLWSELIALIHHHPAQTMVFKVIRAGKPLDISINIGSKNHLFSKPTGYLGIGPQPFSVPGEWLQRIQFGPLTALHYAAQEVCDLVYFNFLILGKMLTGKLSLQSLGGPITIFETAGLSLNQGIIPFLAFLAFLSLSIGVINVLPIPGLDGGHLFFQCIEAIIRRPLPERYIILLFRLGFIFLFVILIQTVINDVLRLASG